MNSKYAQATTFEKLKELQSTPGELHIRINKMQGFFVPFVFFTEPGQEEPVGHGPILNEGDVVASLDMQALITALQESLGNVTIYRPVGAAPTTLH
ncbi:hypothetical protein ACHMW6_00125 (plasmid) [Pseudoduganella sp. UC29_106]|uniref:hypothetical protein n=1 Tax=Pseudoduganella sp. UC29_106 TaxID=3374553 RepID=UPI003757AFC3